MLRLEKTTLGNFGATDMVRLIQTHGWEAILPDALDEKYLLLVADQFRDLLAGVGWNGTHDTARAALPLALLLLSKAGAERVGDHLEVGLETLQATLCFLSTAVDREIVNRILQRQDATPVGSSVIEGLEMLIKDARNQGDSTCRA
jgi:hypothetical protein